MLFLPAAAHLARAALSRTLDAAIASFAAASASSESTEHTEDT